VIGKGGAVIRALTEETGTQIDISDEGVVTIAFPTLLPARKPSAASKS
jgi:polyribonucleotide nucleotidyltransferase